MKYIYYLLVLLVISNAALGQQTKKEEELARKRYEKTIKRDYKYQFLTTYRIVEGNVIATEYYVYNYRTYLVKYFLIAKQIKGVFWTNDGLIEVISPCDEIHWSDVKKGVINWETDYSHNKSTREMLLLGDDSITQYAPYTLKWSNDRGYNPREFSIKSYIKDEDSQTWKDPSGERDIPADEKKFYRLIEKYGLCDIPRADDTLYARHKKDGFRGLIAEFKDQAPVKRPWNNDLIQRTRKEEKLASKRYEKTIKLYYNYQFLTTPYIVEGNIIATEHFVHNYRTYIVEYFLIAKKIKGSNYTSDGIIEVISPHDEIGWSNVKKGEIRWWTDYSSERFMFLLTDDSITKYAPSTLKWTKDSDHNPRYFSVKCYFKNECYFKNKRSQTWRDPSHGRDIPADQKKFYRLIEKYGLCDVPRADDTLYARHKKDYFRGLITELKRQVSKEPLPETKPKPAPVPPRDKRKEWEEYVERMRKRCVSCDSTRNQPTKEMKRKRLKSGGAGTDLNFYIENPRIEGVPGSDSLFFSVDVMLSSNVSRYLGNTIFRLSYKSGTSGTDPFYPGGISGKSIKVIPGKEFR